MVMLNRYERERPDALVAACPDGTVRFANDVYDFDLTLERAVAAAKCGRVV
jgi:hypothetical protein